MNTSLFFKHHLIHTVIFWVIQLLSWASTYFIRYSWLTCHGRSIISLFSKAINPRLLNIRLQIANIVGSIDNIEVFLIQSRSQVMYITWLRLSKARINRRWYLRWGIRCKSAVSSLARLYIALSTRLCNYTSCEDSTYSLYVLDFAGSHSAFSSSQLQRPLSSSQLWFLNIFADDS